MSRGYYYYFNFPILKLIKQAYYMKNAHLHGISHVTLGQPFKDGKTHCRGEFQQPSYGHLPLRSGQA